MGRRRIVMMMVSWEGGEGGREGGREGLTHVYFCYVRKEEIKNKMTHFPPLSHAHTHTPTHTHANTTTELPDLESDEVEVEAMGKEGKE
jgi:hypothetical protein